MLSCRSALRSLRSFAAIISNPENRSRSIEAAELSELISIDTLRNYRNR